MKNSLSQTTLFLTIALFTMLSLPGCGSKRPSEDMELKRSLHKLTKHFPEFDDMIIFYDAEVEDDAIVVLTTLDPEFYGFKIGQGLDELWHDPEWKEEFKEKMVVNHSHLINLAKTAGIDICWRFLDGNDRKWFDLRLNSDEADHYLTLANEKNSIAETAHNKLDGMIQGMNPSLPADQGDGLSFINIQLEPNLLVYNYEVDENITSHKKIEWKIIGLGKGKMSQILQDGIKGDSLLITAADARVGVTYRFKGSKTGYTQDYEVLTVKELKNLKDALE